MNNDREHDGKTNQDVYYGGSQYLNRREASQYGFEGMNFEQQRESYLRGKTPEFQRDRKEKSLRGRTND
ncbi:MAG: hypothetical protein ABR503_03725 [Chitinophagaceae bacterium]